MPETFPGKKPFPIPRAIRNKGGVRAATMTGNETWTTKDSTLQVLDPGSSDRTITLPAVTADELDGIRFLVRHSGVASTITLSDGASVVQLNSGEWAEVASEGTDWYLVSQGVGSTPRGVVEIFDDFNYQAGFTEASTPWILNSGSDDVAVDPAISTPGVLTLTSGDAGTGVAADGSQIVCAVPVQAQSGGLVVEARLHINTAVTTAQLVFGLTDSTSLELPASIGASDTITTNASDAALLVYDTGADTDEWFAVAVDSDTDDTGNAALGTAPVADTYQTLRIEVDADGATIRYYIDGALELTLSGAAGVSPDVNLYATVIVNSTTTTSRTVDLDYLYVKVAR